MNAATLKAVGVIIGVIFVAFGVLGATGVVPGLGVSTPIGKPGVQFHLTASGFNVSLVDQTNTVGNGANVICQELGWSAEYNLTHSLPSCTFMIGWACWTGPNTNEPISPTRAGPALCPGPGARVYSGTELSHQYPSSVPGTYEVFEYWFVWLNTTGFLGRDNGQIFGAFGSINLPSNMTVGSSSVAAGFSWKTARLNVTATDASVAYNANITKVSFTFGTSGPISGSAGFTATYQFAYPGVYNVSEYVYWSAQGTSPQISSVSASIAVGTNATGGSVAASVSIVHRGLTAWANDTSTYTGLAAIQLDSIAWGDGSQGSSSGSLGLHAVHAYSANGTYTVVDTIKWSLNGTVRLSYANSTITVTQTSSGSGNGSCKPNCGNGGGGSASGCIGSGCFIPGSHIDLVTFGLLGIGVALLIAVLVPIDPVMRGILAVAAGGVLAVIGYFIGGTGPI